MAEDPQIYKCGNKPGGSKGQLQSYYEGLLVQTTQDHLHQIKMRRLKLQRVKDHAGTYDIKLMTNMGRKNKAGPRYSQE